MLQTTTQKLFLALVSEKSSNLWKIKRSILHYPSRQNGCSYSGIGTASFTTAINRNYTDNVNFLLNYNEELKLQPLNIDANTSAKNASNNRVINSEINGKQHYLFEYSVKDDSINQYFQDNRLFISFKITPTLHDGISFTGATHSRNSKLHDEASFCAHSEHKCKLDLYRVSYFFPEIIHCENPNFLLNQFKVSCEVTGAYKNYEIHSDYIR